MSIVEFPGPHGDPDEDRLRGAGAGRVPPQDEGAEQSVLGAMMLSKDAIADVVEVIRGADFYRPAHEQIYEAVLDLYGRGEPVDAITVSAELTRAGDLARVGGGVYIHTLVASVPVTANAGYYAEIVREKAILRRLVAAGTKIVQIGYAAEGQVDDVVDRAQAEVYAVTDRRASEDYAPLADLMELTIDELEAIGNRDGAMAGVPTGFVELDELTNGLHAGQMVIVAARPAVGKALALDTPLPTPAGWTTMGEVAVGDRLIGADGLPTRVIAATEVMHGRPCYRVEFCDGTAIVADADHQWRTSRRAAGVPARGRGGDDGPGQGTVTTMVRDGDPAGVGLLHHQIVTTRELAACAHGGQPPVVDNAEPLQLPRMAFARSPYDCGRDVAESSELTIPAAYLRASIGQRRSLLAGLLDGRAGVAADGSIQLCLSSPGQVAGVRDLVVGLGYTCEVTAVAAAGRHGRPVAVQLVRFVAPDQVFGLPDRAATHRRHSTSVDGARRRRITRVTPVTSVAVRCVQVDNESHLYLAGLSMVPTHNSTLGLDIARSASIRHGLTSVIFSLEMSRTEITMRLLSAEARIPLNHMRNGKMSDDDWSKLVRKMGEVSEAPLFIDDSPNLTMMEIRAKARRLKQRHDLRLIIVDYLQLMTSGKKVESRQLEVSEFSRQIKLLAKELEVPVVAISQLNRGSEQRTSKRPLLSDLRESGSLEQDSDMVILLHREDMYEKESTRPGEADLIVAKHRNGPTADLVLAFQGHYSRFVDMAQN